MSAPAPVSAAPIKAFRPNRVLSTVLTRVLLKTPVTPNQVTLSVIALGTVAGILFSKGLYATSLAGALVYALACVLDNCDGEIARAKNLKSKLGARLDIAADFWTDTALFTGLGLGVYRNGGGTAALFFAALGVAGSVMHLGLVILEQQKGFGPAVYEKANPDEERRRDLPFKIFDALREGEASWLVVGFAAFGLTPWLLWGGALYMQILWVSALFLNFRFLFQKT